MKLENRVKLLRRWLRSKGFSKEHVSVGLLWLNKEVSEGRNPSDNAVLSKVDEAEGVWVSESCCKVSADDMKIDHVFSLQYRVYLATFIGSFLGAFVSVQFGGLLIGWIWG